MSKLQGVPGWTRLAACVRRVFSRRAIPESTADLSGDPSDGTRTAMPESTGDGDDPRGSQRTIAHVSDRQATLEKYMCFSLDAGPVPAIIEAEDNNACQVLRLPDELLESVTSRLSQTDRMSLRLAHRRLYCFDSVDVRSLEDSDCDLFIEVLKRDAYRKASVAEGLSVYVSHDERACSACRSIHNLAKFATAQLEQPAYFRSCVASERPLEFCEHKSLTLRRNLNAMAFGESMDIDKDNVLAIMLGQRLGCTHERKPNRFPGGQSSFSLDITSDTARGVFGVTTISVRHKLWIPRDSIYEHHSNFVSSVRSQLILLRDRTCPHFKADQNASCYLQTHRDLTHYLDVNLDHYFPSETTDYGDNWTGTRTKPWRCPHPSCTMSFWITREPALSDPPNALLPRQYSDDIWLNIKQCELPLPLTAHHAAWAAATDLPAEPEPPYDFAASEERIRKMGEHSKRLEREYRSAPC